MTTETPATPDWVARFWPKVDRTPTCWIWTAVKTSRGYGQLKVDGKMQIAHRLSYEIHKGPIPDGLVIDHLCRNRVCVNPDHLEAVTTRENNRRGMAPTFITQRTGVCQRGHSMEDAIQRSDPNSRQRCRTCFELYRPIHEAKKMEYRARLRQQQEAS